MRKFTLLVPLFVLCFSGCQQDVDELVGRHINAMGGLQKQLAVKTVRILQRVEIDNPASNFEFVIMRKRENKFRMEDPPLVPEASVKGTISGCDGQTSWSRVRYEPAEIGVGKLCDGPADMDDLLLNYKEKGISAELAGKETIDGSVLYHLKLTAKNGRVLHFYLDARTYLTARIVVEENGSHQEDNYSDYRKVDGIMVPFCDEMRWWKITTTPPREATAAAVKVNNAPAHQRQIVQKIEFNIPLEDSLFAIPSESGTHNP